MFLGSIVRWLVGWLEFKASLNSNQPTISRPFIHLFVQSDIVTMISHERLEQF